MSSRLDQIKEEILTSWPKEAGAETCVGIIDYLARMPIDELKMLTFYSFREALGRKQVDAELICAVSLLVNTRLHLLEARLLLIDDNQDEFEIETDDFEDAKTTGELIHPETGEPVLDFEDKVIPYFVPTDRLVELKAEAE